MNAPATGQLVLFDLPAPIPRISVHTPDHPALDQRVLPPLSRTPLLEGLLGQHVPVAVGISGGKDGSAAALAVVGYLDTIGHCGPRVLIHSDLGRVEWQDSIVICRQLARRLDLPLIVVSRGRGDMVDRWLQRWDDNVGRYQALSCLKLILPWSTPDMRFCTSELKGAIIARELVNRFPGQVIVSVAGIRKQESAARAKSEVLKVNNRLTNKRTCTSGYDWNPILDYTEEDVWTAHHRYDLPIHEAYSLYNNSRVSCCFCILGKQTDWHNATTCAQNQAVYRELVDLEITSTFGFTDDRWLGDVNPALLSDDQRAGIVAAKKKAKQRQLAEAALPAHLLYTKGWPTALPTYSEATLVGHIRAEVGRIVSIDPGMTEPVAIMERFGYLYATARQKEAEKARLQAIRSSVKAGSGS